MSSNRPIRFALMLALACAAVVPAFAAAPDCTGISSVIPNNSDLTGDLTTIRVASGFSSAVGMAVAPGDDTRIFVVEQQGIIKVIENGVVLGTPFINLDNGPVKSNPANEEGLLSMAFHPDYQSNGLFFVYYTDNSGNQNVARYEVTGNPNVADDTSGQVVLNIPHPGNTNHNGGQLEFSPEDGRLYVGVGDGGASCDPGPGDGNGQNKNTLLGKLLRLDVSTGPLATYTTTGNPFDGITPGRDEVWSYGLRNPYTFTFDQVTSNVYIADVGQFAWEEVDCGRPPSEGGGGENYGWVFHEGNQCPASGCGGSASDCNPPDYVPPVKVYSLSGSPCSVIGGYVYRGCRMDPLHGTYFYGDHCTFTSTASFRTDETCSAGATIARNSDLVPEPGDGSISSITAWGQDNKGEEYIVARNAGLYKIIPNFDIHEVSGARAYPFTFSDTAWTFEDLSEHSDWSPDWYRVYRSISGPTGPFTCKKLVRTTDCDGSICSYANGDPVNPSPGGVYYYLATAWLDSEESRAGAQSDGTLRVVDSGSVCPFP